MGESIKKASFLAIFLILSLVFLTVTLVYAPIETLGTGYAITSDYHGIDVPPGTPVTVTALTLDENVVRVTFRWHAPPDGNGPVVREVDVTAWANGTLGQWNDGTWALIRYAEDTWVPDEVGDWGVQAFFRDSTGSERAGLRNVISVKATSFFVTPEIPLGTIGAIATMILALAMFTLRKKAAGSIKIQIKS